MRTHRLPKPRLFLLALALFCSNVFGQAVISQYPAGKIFLKNGYVLEGKNLRLSMELVTFEILGQDQVFPLSDISQIMAKKGKGRSYGKTCAIIAVSISALTWISSDGKTENESSEEKSPDILQFASSSLMLGGLSYGIGYSLGMFGDMWEVVYLERQ